MWLGPFEVLDLGNCVLAIAGLALVAVPLCDALEAAVEFANRPAHRVTPAAPWEFFDRELKRRLRKCVVVWALIFPVNVCFIAALTACLRIAWIHRHIGDFLKIGLQSGFFTLSAIFAQAGFVAVIASRMARKRLLLGASIASTAALFVLTVIVMRRLPPMVADMLHMTFRLSNGSIVFYVATVRFGWDCIYTASAYLAFCAAAWGWFLATRKESRLFSPDD